MAGRGGLRLDGAQGLVDRVVSAFVFVFVAPAILLSAVVCSSVVIVSSSQ